MADVASREPHPTAAGDNGALGDAGLLVSYAQHGEDIVLWRAFRHQTGGTYVDVGAFHPTHDSVTRLFYERGWRGINIDANPDSIEAFQRERPDDINLCLAASDGDGEIEFFVCDNPGWSTTNPQVAAGLSARGQIQQRRVVPARRLSSVLDEAGTRSIDFLKIDTEGAEAAVLRGLDLNRHRPRVIVVEAVAPVISNAGQADVNSILQHNGYLHAGFDGLNDYFASDNALLAALHSPANPTDEYVRNDVLALRQEIATLKAQQIYYIDREPEIRALERWAHDLEAELNRGRRRRSRPTAT